MNQLIIGKQIYTDMPLLLERFMVGLKPQKIVSCKTLLKHIQILVKNKLQYPQVADSCLMIWVSLRV